MTQQSTRREGVSVADRDCHHGELARSCALCEIERDINEMTSEIAALRAQLEQARAEQHELILEANKLDAVVHALGIEDTFDEPAAVIRGLQATIARQRAWIESAGHRPGCASTRKCAHCGKPPWSYRHLVDAVGFDHDFQPGPCDCGWAELAGG